MEILDVVDENGEPTGEKIDREIAHATGVRHRTSHVWVSREYNGKKQILLQKRSKDKDAYPGCYDISSAGHIPAGCTYVESAMRELKEELGMDSKPDEYIYCGLRKDKPPKVNFFHGKKFIDYQISAVFVIHRNQEADNINFQREEIESVVWMDFEKCVEMVNKNTIPNCISIDELNMIWKWL